MGTGREPARNRKLELAGEWASKRAVSQASVHAFGQVIKAGPYV